VIKDRLRLWGFKPPREVATAFGRLERQVMDVVWQRGEVSVRDVHAEFGGTAAYTTVMTAMDRLYKKGVLARRKSGRAYVYAAAASQAQLEQSVATDLVAGLLGEGSESARPLLSSLVDAVGERDRVLLDELERLVREKRRQLRRGESG
jgi:predicted transcriptional regulator